MQHLNDLLQYDPIQGLIFWKQNRGNGIKAGDQAGFIHHTGYKEIEVSGKSYRYHRVCWFLQHGCEPDGQIDHINGDRCDNRIKNLRVVTNRNNSRNRMYHRQGKLIGACFVKRKNNWMSSIRINGKNTFLGYYDTEQQASDAYVKRSKEIGI